MRFPTYKVVLGAAFVLTFPATDAWAHWCDDMWISAYNIVVRPDSDTSPKALYVQNNMGYQLPNFKLRATSSSGGAITFTAPTTLKVANTLLPGERGTWKIASGSPARVEDIAVSISFGVGVQSQCYPLVGGSAVMVVKTDGSLYPATPTGLDDPKAPSNGCVGIISCATSLIDQAITDFEDLDIGLDKLLQLYCAGRASWGVGDAVTKTYCKDTGSTTCPTRMPSGVGMVTDYPHLWAAGELAIRKGSLGARLPVFRERLKCGANDGDSGFAGYALFVLGYLGDDAEAKSFLQAKASAGGDVGTIAKAALYLMGDAAQKSEVQAGVQSSSVFVKVACAAALGIVDKDDAVIDSALIPQVKWNNPSEASEDGRGMYAAHILEIVAFDRRGWVFKGMGDGAVTFYGETGGGTGGTSGTGGAMGSGGISGGGGTTADRDGGGDVRSGKGEASAGGGRAGSGGATTSGSVASGGVTGEGGSPSSGGQGGGGAASGGSVSSSASGNGSGGSSPVSSGGNGGGMTGDEKGQSSGCSCTLGGRPDRRVFSFLALAALAFLLLHRGPRSSSRSSDLDMK